MRPKVMVTSQATKPFREKRGRDEERRNLKQETTLSGVIAMHSAQALCALTAGTHLNPLNTIEFGQVGRSKSIS
jgi:hypothetical protein